MRKRIAWRNSIFTRLMATFLLLLLPLYILGILVFQWSKDMMSKQIFASMQLQTEFIINNLDNEIQRIRMLQLDIITDSDLELLTYAADYLGEYERSKAINRIRDRLTTMQNSSALIKEASVHIQSIGLSINSAGTNKGSIDKLSSESLAFLGSIPDSVSPPVIHWNENLILKVFNYRNRDESLPSVLVFQLSESELRKLLTNNYTDIGYKSFFLLTDQDYLFTSDADDAIAMQLTDQLASSWEGPGNEVVAADAHGNKYFLFSAPSSSMGAIVSQYISEDTVFHPLAVYEMMYKGFSMLAILIVAVYSVFTFRLIQKPLLKLVGSFDMLQQGNFNIKTDGKHVDEITFLYKCFDEMVQNLKTIIDQVYKQKILVQRAELKQLQSQISPHFLYNSFFLLQKRIRMGDYEDAESFSEELASYFRFITRNASDDIDLENEVEHARIYAGIQAARFANRIAVEFGVLPESHRKILVPRLILQPLIENAFVHGLEPKEDNGLLKVSFSRQDTRLVIAVEDNGEYLSQDKLEKLKQKLSESMEENEKHFTPENTALINIHKRLRLALGERSGLRVMRSAIGGVRVEVCLAPEAAQEGELHC